VDAEDKIKSQERRVIQSIN
jgi:hypothetical protein